jgi:hypothetical protein
VIFGSARYGLVMQRDGTAGIHQPNNILRGDICSIVTGTGEICFDL